MISDNQLSPLLGMWAGRESLSKTAWTEAGTADGRLTIVTGPSGGLLIDYEERRDSATLIGHGVVAGEGWWWFDSHGFTPATPGSASWVNGELRLERCNARGRTVTVLRIVDNRLEQRIDTAVPADGALAPLLRGVYSRCTSE